MYASIGKDLEILKYDILRKTAAVDPKKPRAVHESRSMASDTPITDGWGRVSHTYANSTAHQAAVQRGHDDDRVVLSPSLGTARSPGPDPRPQPGRPPVPDHVAPGPDARDARITELEETVRKLRSQAEEQGTQKEGEVLAKMNAMEDRFHRIARLLLQFDDKLREKARLLDGNSRFS